MGFALLKTSSLQERLEVLKGLVWGAASVASEAPKFGVKQVARVKFPP